jgi:hypothetical protein
LTGYVGGRGYRFGGLPVEAVMSVASAMFGIKNAGLEDLLRHIQEMGPRGRAATARMNARKADAVYHRVKSQKRDPNADDGSQEWLDRESVKQESQFRGALVVMSRRYPDDEKLAAYCRKIGLPA